MIRVGVENVRIPRVPVRRLEGRHRHPKFANELWQADTLHGPAIRQANGQWKKTFLIAFIDDATRVVVHAEFFYRDDTQNMVQAFRSALYKRGKPARLYFDNDANYSAREVAQACLRLGGIQMTPLDRFNLDRQRIAFLTDDAFTAEVFYLEEDRKVSKTNVFSFHSQRFECPVDLREKTIQVRHDRHRRDAYIVYFGGQRMGQAWPLDLVANARLRMPEGGHD